MARALELASRARGRTSPNPMVGAVLVVRGRDRRRRFPRPRRRVPRRNHCAGAGRSRRSRGRSLRQSRAVLAPRAHPAVRRRHHSGRRCAGFRRHARSEPEGRRPGGGAPAGGGREGPRRPARRRGGAAERNLLHQRDDRPAAGHPQDRHEPRRQDGDQDRGGALDHRRGLAQTGPRDAQRGRRRPGRHRHDSGR